MLQNCVGTNLCGVHAAHVCVWVQVYVRVHVAVYVTAHVGVHAVDVRGHKST